MLKVSKLAEVCTLRVLVPFNFVTKPTNLWQIMQIMQLKLLELEDCKHELLFVSNIFVANIAGISVV